MIEAILTIIAGIVGVIAIIIKKRISADEQIKRERQERDEDIAAGDYEGTSKRLSDLYDRVQEQRRNNSR